MSYVSAVPALASSPGAVQLNVADVESIEETVRSAMSAGDVSSGVVALGTFEMSDSLLASSDVLIAK